MAGPLGVLRGTDHDMMATVRQGSETDECIGMNDNADPVLTLRIAFDSPSAGVSTTAGNRLDAAGFKVEAASPRGLLIAGTRSLMEQFFDTRIDFREKKPQFTG